MKYVHSLKQLDIYYILEAWKDDNNIKKVVILDYPFIDIICNSLAL